MQTTIGTFPLADAAYERGDQGWFNALSTKSLVMLWKSVSQANYLSPAGAWDDEVYDALDARGYFEEV